VADWVTISSLATAGGTLALAAATFGSVRSGNRTARVAELALQEQRRPVLMHSRTDDGDEVIRFADDHWVTVHGGGAALDIDGGSVYLALSLRNVGAGIAVLQSWHAHDSVVSALEPPTDLDEFRALTRDQYIAAGNAGVWQAAVREADDPLRATLTAASAERRAFSVELLYTDQVGGQRTISRFGVLPADGGGWLAAVGRHWYLDAVAPR
jgi:hypothetical protein